METIINSSKIISSSLKNLICNEAIEYFDQAKYQGDNASYCISLFEEYYINKDENIKLFLSDLGKSLIKWIKSNLNHGYFNIIDVHHGSEVFLGFLPRYIRMFPEDEEAKSLIIQVSEYIGNWDEKIYPWFDYEEQFFKSFFLGTEGADISNDSKYNTADHLRLIHILLIAWEISGEKKYLKFSENFCVKFAKRILESSEKIPLAWDIKNKGYFQKDMTSPKEKFVISKVHHSDDDELSGIESLIASGFIYTFGYLYNLYKEDIFLKASRKIIQILIPILTLPYSDSASSMISYYRKTFGDYTFDQDIILHQRKMSSTNIDELMLGIFEKEKNKLKGIGKRKDMIYWYYLDKNNLRLLNEPPTSFFCLMYQITGEIKYVERAFNIASRKIRIGSSKLKLGYQHSDAGCYLSSVISGHGRNWGIGAITGFYGPLLIGSDEGLGLNKSSINFVTPSLINNQCISLTRNISKKQDELEIYNFSNKLQKIEFINNLKKIKISINVKPKSKKLLSL